MKLAPWLMTCALALSLASALEAQTQFQVNQSTASMSVDNVLATTTTKATVMSCIGNLVTLNFASPLSGQVYDVALSARVLRSVAGGAFVSTGGQIANLDFTDPAFVWMFGGVTVGNAPFPGNFSCVCPVAPFSPSGVLTQSGQMLILDPTAPDGSTLSQGCEIVYGMVTIGPATDDSGVTLALANLGPCAPASLPFYSTFYTSVSVISNGRLIFGVIDTDFSPTVAEALTDSPFFGAWTDMNPGTAGTVRIMTDSPTALRVEYRGVPYFAQAAAINNFDLIIDASGVVTINGVNGLVAGTAQTFLGVSSGITGPATDPGLTAFTVGGPNAGPTFPGMIYNFALQGSTAPGVAQLVFIPNGGGSFDWIAL